jgi:hypothetical protein
VDHGAQRALLGVEDFDEPLAVFGERFELREGGVDLFAATVDRFAERLLPDLELAPRLRVERLQDAVERHRVFDLAVGQATVVGQRPRGRALRDQLHVGLPEQRLLAQDRMHVRTDRRVARVDFDGRDGAPFRAGLDRDHATDVHAGDADIRLFGERERFGEADGETVTLWLQRHRPSEGLPQEQQQPEAAEHEEDDHEHVPERGRALLHLSLRLPARSRASDRQGAMRRCSRARAAP